MKKCLILGGSGFIGKPLVKELTKEHSVVSYSLEYVEEFQGNERVTSVVGDFTKENNFKGLLDGIDTVYHLVSTTLPSDRTDHIPQEIQDNIIPTIKLLEAMVECGVKNIIFASSGGTVYGESDHYLSSETDPLSPKSSYGLQKCIIEDYLKFYGLKYDIQYKIARISNPYGIGQNINKPQGVIPIFLNRIANQKPITIYGDGEVVRDYIYMDDVIRALIQLGKYDGKEHVFNVGSGKGHSLNEIMQIMRKIIGEEISVEYIPNRNCDVKVSVLNTSRIKAEIEWQAEVELWEGITMILEYQEKYK